MSEDQQLQIDGEDQPVQLDYEQLLAAKAEMLRELLKRKPGEKGYKRSLKAFLDADADAQQALLDRLTSKGPFDDRT